MRQMTRAGRLREARRIATILRQSKPARIILFGSSATGPVRPGSDIDLCILVDSLNGRPSFRIKQDLYKLLMSQHYDFPVDVDVHVYTVADFQDRLARNDPFLCNIASGQVLYERG